MDRYEEALERAKAGKPMDEVFPELKESEDERIRKMLVEQMERWKKCAEDNNVEQDVKDASAAIAYLEKQKEQKPNIELIQRSWYMEGYHDREFCREPKWIIKTGECGPRYEKNEKYGQPLEQKPKAIRVTGSFVDGSYKYDLVDMPNPAEWSEEDEKCLQTLIDYFSSEQTDIQEYGKKAAINWLKSLCGRPQPIQLKESYKEGFQTARHAMALAFIKYCDKNRPNGKMCLSNGECEEIENAFLVGDWEKIERYFHKYSWKPSEEQMCELNWASKLSPVLESLYNDLKKLC